MVSVSVYAQNILVVDNTETSPSGTNYYADLQAAVNASQSGDTLLINPSNDSYGNIDFIGRDNLTLIGAGLAVNRSVNQFTTESKVGTMKFDGSTNISVIGIEINRISDPNLSGSKNLYFEEVAVSDVHLIESSNVIFKKCYMSNALRIDNVYIENCVITSRNNSTQDYDNSTLRNNLFFSMGFSGGNSTSRNDTFINNLFVNVQNEELLADDSHTFINNFSDDLNMPWSDGDNGAVNNIALNIPNNEIFADSSITDGDVWNLEWSMEVIHSQILNGGDDGTNIGPTGGSDPLIYPAYSLPTIFSLIAPTNVQEGEDIEVTIKAKGN